VYRIEFTKRAHKDLKSLSKQVIVDLGAHVKILSGNPFKGERLKGALRDYWKYQFTSGGVSYRIAYQIFEKNLLILVVMLGSRENFYKQLLKRIG